RAVPTPKAAASWGSGPGCPKTADGCIPAPAVRSEHCRPAILIEIAGCQGIGARARPEIAARTECAGPGPQPRRDRAVVGGYEVEHAVAIQVGQGDRLRANAPEIGPTGELPCSVTEEDRQRRIGR